MADGRREVNTEIAKQYTRTSPSHEQINLQGTVALPHMFEREDGREAGEVGCAVSNDALRKRVLHQGRGFLSVNALFKVLMAGGRGAVIARSERDGDGVGVGVEFLVCQTALLNRNSETANQPRRFCLTDQTTSTTELKPPNLQTSNPHNESTR